jgi:phosphate starvation-inducible protein PhoH and related proteins
MSKRRTGQEIPRINISAKSDNQQHYLDSITNDIVTICLGLAGTGKTFLAVAQSLSLLQKGEYQRIILSRPIVETGEQLGYLPGGFEQKVDPYMVPLYDVLKKFLDHDQLQSLKSANKLEICPLAYMRGRSFDESIVILDEAQNTTIHQLKMFLTRLGKSSKAIICGDPSQSDLMSNGLRICASCLSGLDHISVVGMSADDIVRNDLIASIIERIESATMYFRPD